MTSTIDMTTEEMSESLTGFDEIAITKHLGIDLYVDGQKHPMLLMRALVFVHLRREGAKDLEAKDVALSMRVKEVTEYFADDTELDPEDPVTESGKDVSPPVSELAS